MAKIKMSHVPYRGAVPALERPARRPHPLLFSAIPNVHSHIGAGTVRALAVTSAKRSSLAAGRADRRRIGFPGFDAMLGYGLLAPAGTPRPIIDRLNRELRAALANEAVLKLLRPGGRRAARDHAGGIHDDDRPRGAEMVGADQGHRPEPQMIRQMTGSTRMRSWLFALVAASLAVMPAHSAGLSHPADHAGRSLCRRRRQRRDGAHRRREDEQDARPADRHRQPARRRRRDSRRGRSRRPRPTATRW